MAGYCDGQIMADIQPDCLELIVKGLEQEGVIMNRADVDLDLLKYGDSDTIVKSLAMKDGKKAYKVIISNKMPFNGTSTSLVEGTNRNTFTNVVGMVILANNPDVSHNIIDGLANGEFVVILENKSKSLDADKPGYSAFQVYGALQGLRATELTQEKYSEDTEGGWNVVLTEVGVPKSALFFWNTDLATTRAAIATLQTL